MDIQKELMDWAEKTVETYKNQPEDLGFYTQTPLSIFLDENIKEPDLLILGINPGSGGGIKEYTGTELLKGNPCFERIDNDYIINELKNKEDKIKNTRGWALWHQIYRMLEYSNRQELLEDINNFVISNMIFFGTENEKQIPKKIDLNECARRTVELVNILHPKIVLLLGSNATTLFEEVSKLKLGTLVDNSISYLKYSDNTLVLSIKHTAYHYSNLEKELIGKTIGYALDHHLVVNQECIKKEFSDIIQKFEMMIRINLLNREITRPYKKDKCPPYSKISKIDYTKLVFEFFTSIHPHKKCYVNSKNKIVLSLIPENDHFFINICQGDKDGQFKLVEWLRKENYLMKEDKLSFPINTSNKEIIDTIICVLEGVKRYRDEIYQI